MSKKAKTEVDEKSAVIITDAVLAENDKKLKELSASIQNALKRKQKIGSFQSWLNLYTI